MKKLIRVLTSGTVIMAIAYIVIGIVMVIYPTVTMKTLVYYGAISLIVIGSVNVLRYVLRGLRGGVLNNFMVTGSSMIIIGIVPIIFNGLFSANDQHDPAALGPCDPARRSDQAAAFVRPAATEVRWLDLHPADQCALHRAFDRDYRESV